MTEQEYPDKQTLLDRIQKSYRAFDTLLAPLSEQQLSTLKGSDGWTMKDHIAHLIAWQQRTLNNINAIMDNIELSDPTPDMTIDQINERFYQQYTLLSVERVLAEHRVMQQQMLHALQIISEEDLYKPVPWLNNRPVVGWVVGNTYEHYEEHMHDIQKWLS
jgi:hypothetical protein